MKYELTILRRNENEKDFQVVNTLKSEDEINVLRTYTRALKQYTFKKNYSTIEKVRYTRKPYTYIEEIEILYCNEYYTGNVYTKYIYKFEDIEK